MFIPDKAHKQILSAYQHKVFAPIRNISHIVSTLLRCGLQRNDQYRTHNQRLVPLLLSNHQRKEQLGQCRNPMECQSWIPPNPSLPSVWRTKKSIRRKPIDFGFSGPFDFLFLSCPNKISVRWIRCFIYCSTTRIGLKVQVWHSADVWCTESLSRSERRKIKKNWMMADRWSSLKQDGSQEQLLCPPRLERNRVVWRCSCHKERGLSPENL